MSVRSVRAVELVRLAVILAVFVAAPVAGDIGSCGQREDDLDPSTFFSVKKGIDCEQCRACALVNATCTTACSSGAPDPDAFPPGCVPLVHDGEVCLDALYEASCGDYANFTLTHTVPTECDFCPPRTP